MVKQNQLSNLMGLDLIYIICLLAMGLVLFFSLHFVKRPYMNPFLLHMRTRSITNRVPSRNPITTSAATNLVSLPFTKQCRNLLLNITRIRAIYCDFYLSI